MAGSGDEIAARVAGHLRASHADRNRVIDVLKAAFTQGMLGKDEFDLRVGQVLTSRTYADLAALTADIPATLAAAQPAPTRQSQERRFVRVLARQVQPANLRADQPARPLHVWQLRHATIIGGPTGRR